MQIELSYEASDAFAIAILKTWHKEALLEQKRIEKIKTPRPIHEVENYSSVLKFINALESILEYTMPHEDFLEFAGGDHNEIDTTPPEMDMG